MLAKKVTALLVSAALVLALLAGCGGGRNQSLSQMLLNLLDGQYQNVSVEIDSDLESKLRQAISESETDEELRAALEGLLGGGIRFQRLGSGQQGDSAWTLILYPGTDPNAAARSVYLDLDKVFAALPADGQYSSGFAMAETENGYAILVKATVDKAGTEDKPDPVTLESIAVTTQPTKTTYWVGESFNPANMVITATYSNNTTKDIDAALCSLTIDGADATEYKFGSAGSYTVTISYGGKTATVTVTVKEPEVEKIEVTTDPNKTEYEINEVFIPTGMVITATYSDNVKTETIDSNYEAKGVTWEPTTIAADTEKVTIKYQGKEAEVTITLTPPTLEGIQVTWSDRETYYTDESITKSGVATVTADYSYGVDKTLNPNEYKLTIKGPGDNAASVEITDNYAFTAAGDYTLTVTYLDEYQDEKTITVADKGYEIEDNTYKVSNTHGLQAWNEAVQKDLTLNCTLTDDIDLKGIDWTPIGNYDNPYIGTFDGNGKTITGLTVGQKETDNVGLIGYLGSGGKVQNLTLENVNLNGNLYVGGVVGYSNNGTVTACTASGSINGKEYVGGIVGSNYLGTVTACYNTSSTVNGSYLVGGVVGQNNKGIVTACYNASGSIYGEVTVGGVVGDNYTGTVTACYWSDYVGNGIGNGNGGETTRVDGTTVTWQTAVGGMNAALTGNDYQWALGTDGLPVLQSNQ